MEKRHSLLLSFAEHQLSKYVLLNGSNYNYKGIQAGQAFNATLHYFPNSLLRTVQKLDFYTEQSMFELLPTQSFEVCIFDLLRGDGRSD